MADIRETNETGAAAAEPATGDQQVWRNGTQNDTYYKAEAYCELIWNLESHVDKLLWGINHDTRQATENIFYTVWIVFHIFYVSPMLYVCFCFFVFLECCFQSG